MSSLTLVDAHVHLYGGFDFARAFGAGIRNLQALAPSFPSPADLCLCLTEDRDHDVFSSLPEFEDQNWTVRRHPDGKTMRVENGQSQAGLWVFAGKQLVTAERIEVLALLADPNKLSDLRDGKPLDETVRQVEATGALVVLPWAFGKWMFGRGQLIRQFVHSTTVPFFLGDNGGRWDGLKGLRPSSLAAEVGRPVLPGSDPLPLAAHEDSIGRYGFALPMAIDAKTPCDSLRTAIATLEQSPAPVGRTASLGEFVTAQWKLRTERLPLLDAAR